MHDKPCIIHFTGMATEAQNRLYCSYQMFVLEDIIFTFRNQKSIH